MRNKKQKTQNARLSFSQAMSKINTLTSQDGLTALKGNERCKILPTNKRMVNGSADIDSSYLASEPISQRWDYVIGYKNQAYFVEIHPACTSQVAKVIGKLEWLKNKLKGDLHPLDRIKADTPFHWIASGSKIDILSTSKEYKQCAAKGLLPKAVLNL